MKKVYAEVFGCAANQSDFEIALGLLKESGFKIVDDPKKSDIILIFTCIVKTPTVNRMIDRIKKLSELNRPLIVAGCMPRVKKELIEKINPKASMIGPDSIDRIVDVVEKSLKGKRIILLEEMRSPKLCLPRVRRNPVVNIVQINEGCLSKCSYCVVKLARGNLISYPIELIKKDIKISLKEGCREIWLTSQDTACYGRDMGTNLAQLLKEICRIEGKFFVRVGMMNPSFVEDILDELLEAYEHEKIFKFLHLPIQSFSKKVLKLMGRNYTPKTVLRIIRSFYRKFPDLTLATDIIVGFPGEEDSDFKRTIKFIKEVRPDIVNISKFGAHPETEASKLKKLPTKIVKERSSTLSKLVKKISLDKNERWVGWEGECLIDEKGKENTWIARNFAYKPIVIESREKLLGKFVKVRITDFSPTYLRGKIV